MTSREPDANDDERPPPSLGRSREELADYLLDIGATLAACGCPSYRVEDVIRAVAEREGQRAEPFALPTGLFLRVTPRESSLGDVSARAPEVHRMKRLWPSGVDLGRLAEVDEIFNAVAERELDIHEARVRIRDVVGRAPLYGAGAAFAATVLVSASAAVFFRGRPADVLASSVAGVAVALIALVASRRSVTRLLVDFFAACAATAVAWSAARLSAQVSPEIVVLAGAISLFPGMTFTTGVAEIAQKNLVSGGARFMEALVTLLLLAFGVALAAGVGEVVHVALPTPPPRYVPPLGATVGALVVASAAFGVLFQVPRRFFWSVFASGATGFVVSTAAARALPSHVAAFLSAFAVSALANVLARRTSRPAQVFQLPGMMLLVPGSFGFLSVSDFLRGEVLSGVSRAFTMMLVGAALVLGVLVANALIAPRKLL